MICEMCETETMTPVSPRWHTFCGELSAAVLSLGCKHDFSHAKRIMNKMGGIDVPASLAFFKQHGGYCDDEILLNVMCHFDSMEEEHE